MTGPSGAAGHGRPVIVIEAPAGASVADGRTLLRRLVEVAADTGAGSAHRGTPGAPRTWLVLGEMAGADDVQRTVVEHDQLGRTAVRLAVDKVLCVGGSRAVRAAHQGAVMEGSWGDEAGLVADADELARRWRSAEEPAPAPGDVLALVGDWDRDAVLDVLSERDLVVRRI